METANGNSNVQENWQIEVAGKIYEAEFSELEQWIDEGSLQRTDKVKYGNLRWIEAGKVPKLVNFFNLGDGGNKSEIKINRTDATTQNRHFVIESAVTEEKFQLNSNRSFDNTNNNFQPTNDIQTKILNANVCCFHPEIQSVYLCETCSNGFCQTCPKSYGGSVKICPYCGAMCKPLDEVKKASQNNYRRHADLNEGFGLADFGKSFAYPFKFKLSFIFGAIFFIFFSLGQSGAAFGGVMLFAALISLLGSNMLGFGILANTLENFSQGKTDADFMPPFETFSIWDDVVQPFFLSIAVYAVSFGLFLAILLGGIFYSTNGVKKTENQALMQKVGQINQIKKEQNTTNPNEPMTAESQQKLQNAQAEQFDKLMKQMQDANAADQSQPTADQGSIALSGDAPSFGLPLMMLLAISLLWAIFYFPAACAVAGYTRSFGAIFNLSIGFDTIKRLGADYLKVLLMFAAVVIMFSIITSICAVALMPFEIPMLGNLPLKVVSGLLTFYLTVVTSCILGFALYKNSHKLELLPK